MRGALFSMWIYGSIGFCVGMRGRNLYSYCAGAAPAPPLSFSCVKKKEGGERKSLIQQTHGKRTRRIFLSYPLEIAIAPWGRPPLEERGYAPFFTPHVGNKSCKIFGAIVRNSAYQPGSVSFSRATSALTRVVYLGAHPNCTIRWGLPVLGRRALSIKIR